MTGIDGTTPEVRADLVHQLRSRIAFWPSEPTVSSGLAVAWLDDAVCAIEHADEQLAQAVRDQDERIDAAIRKALLNVADLWDADYLQHPPRLGSFSAALRSIAAAKNVNLDLFLAQIPADVAPHATEPSH
jgi:hypothetical protein